MVREPQLQVCSRGRQLNAEEVLEEVWEGLAHPPQLSSHKRFNYSLSQHRMSKIRVDYAEMCQDNY